MHPRAFTTAATLLVAASAAGAQRPEPAHPAALRQLLLVDSVASRQTTERGLTALTPLLASDAYYLAPGLPILRGTTAIVSALRGASQDGGASRRIGWHAAGAGISADGTLGYTYGYTESSDSTERPTTGKYMAVWRKDGDWRLLGLVLSTPAAEGHARIGGAATGPSRVPRSAPDGGADARRAVLSADSAFARRAASAGIGAAFAACAAADAAVLPGGSRIVSGPDSIGAVYGKLAAGSRLEWAPVDAEAAASGDLAFTVGEAVLSAPDRGSRGERRWYSKYLTIWRRQGDGSWKYVVDGGNERPETRSPAR